MIVKTKDKPKKRVLKSKKKYMGSDCAYCSLEEGVTCMMYFCKKMDKDKNNPRQICYDGFVGTCEFYKLPTKRKIKKTNSKKRS